MSLHRRDAKRDASERAIILTLEVCGFSVEQLSEADVPDLLIGRNGVTALVECKTGKAKLRKGQRTWADSWRGAPVRVLRSEQDVMDLVRTWPNIPASRTLSPHTMGLTEALK